MHTINKKFIDYIYNKYSSYAEANNSPFILAISGSVASGKSYFSMLIKNTLLETHKNLNIRIVSSDSFLYPKAYLIENNIMNQKGFPISYNKKELFDFLKAVKSNSLPISIPIYSHELYDTLSTREVLNKCDIIIFEGVINLQDIEYNNAKILDFYDLKIYLNASENNLKKWYTDRFFENIKKSKDNPNSKFAQYINLPESSILKSCNELWEKVNYINLINFIEPSMKNADIVINKNSSHEFDF
jgi:type I pantothenate kinase